MLCGFAALALLHGSTAFDVSDALAAHHVHKSEVKAGGGAFGRKQGVVAALTDGGDGGSLRDASAFPGLELVSRGATATADTHGNLGAPVVVVQAAPGADWLKDRWQAASDMGGTAIPGEHWVQLRLAGLSTVQRARLDWEAAYCDDYALQLSEGNVVEDKPGRWVTLWDSRRATDAARRVSHSSGTSPGAKGEPLHVVHDLDLRSMPDGDPAAGAPPPPKPAVGRFVRILMRKPAHGWGVSLWQVSLWGECVDAANICDSEAAPTLDAGVDDRSWREAQWLTAKTYCDDYNSAPFKAAMAAVQRSEYTQPALARFLYPLFAEFSGITGRVTALLKKTHAFFEKHGLHYVLYAGSLIGALRHGGVIPFDTDADIQVPVAEFSKLAKLAPQVEAEMGVKLQKNSISFLFMGSGVKIDVWPVYESWDAGKPVENGGIDAATRGPDRPFISKKYWKDDNIPAAEIVNAVLVKFDDFEARVPKRGKFYAERLYGKSVLTTVKVWNDDFNNQHCNNCNWSPNAFAIPMSVFGNVHRQYLADQKTKRGCRN